ncbi:MAG: beta-ketoacyl-[acyl-carrier-protein] synthase family protein [Muribaculaceae bacterium]|nr:beta-ketoacyl-[acyl-carrier-protein] synthase family protein [Muribaculaceae bacterium]
MRVVVTGFGIISALGTGVEATADALRKGRSGVAPVSYLATGLTHLPVGEVRLTNAQMADLTDADEPESELRTVLMGIIAGREAVASAKLSEADIARAAFISGTTVGGMDRTEMFFDKVFESNACCDDVVQMRSVSCGTSTVLTADAIGRFRTVTTSSTACSSAANAIALGADMIKAGLIDVAVAGGSEALSRFHVNGFNTLMILDSERCRPFDRDRAGINLGEGAAFLVIESEESARRRGVEPIAVLSGYANACDAFHQTAGSDNGEGPFRSMSAALAMAGLKPSDISYINTHGTGTPNNDVCELTAMERIWHDALPPFSSTKPLTGHTTSASGSIESVLSLLAMQGSFLPANLGFANPIKKGAEPVKTTVEGVELKHIVKNSFGFGGNDTTLIFSKP